MLFAHTILYLKNSNRIINEQSEVTETEGERKRKKDGERLKNRERESKDDRETGGKH